MKRLLPLAVLVASFLLQPIAHATYYYFATNSFYTYEGQTLVGTLYRSDTGGPNPAYIQLLTNGFTGITPIVLSTDISGQTTFAPYNQVAVNFSGSSLSGTFSLTGLQRTGVQNDRGLILNFAPPYGPSGAPAGTIQQPWFIVQDNDYTMAVSAIPTSVVEGGSVGYFAFDRSTNNAFGPVTVNFTLEGSATYGTDYTISSPFALNTGSSSIPTDNSTGLR